MSKYEKLYFALVTSPVHFVDELEWLSHTSAWVQAVGIAVPVVWEVVVLSNASVFAVVAAVCYRQTHRNHLWQSFPS
jgi:uncharacterized membrane protein YagU involved in acid resistance